MKKVESIFNGFMGWGKTKFLNTYTQILFVLLSLILHKIFLIQRGEEGASASHPRVETLSERLVHLNLTLPIVE